MKKLESTLLNMVVVLVSVAVITGGLLAWVNNVTEEPIRIQDQLALDNGIKSVMGVDELKVTESKEVVKNFGGKDYTFVVDSKTNKAVVQNIGGKDYTFVVHKVNNANGEFIGAAVESTTLGFGGDLKVLVGFDAKGKILGYTLLQHAETPGLGAKADKWFQKDGKGNIVGRVMDANKPLVVKNDGGDIDAITASTITTRAFLAAVNQAFAAYAEQDIDGATGATSVK